MVWGGVWLVSGVSAVWVGAIWLCLFKLVFRVLWVVVGLVDCLRWW